MPPAPESTESTESTGRPDQTTPPVPQHGGVVVCVDVGSTFTKAAAIGPDGSVLATAQHPTTSAGDVLEGLDAAVAALGTVSAGAQVVACSSAGGGLRLAVVGQERVISAEAARRVALSAGARVVGVWAGMLDAEDLVGLAAARPDLVLLVGGTDGGDEEVLRHNAAALGASALAAPVVVAGNAAAAGEVAPVVAGRAAGGGGGVGAGAADSADAAGAGAAGGGGAGGTGAAGAGAGGARKGGAGSGGVRVVHVTANVIPRIGVLDPGPARRAIREVFIAHVIGGKGLSADPRFARLVAAATPDAVLAGIEVVAEVLAERPGASGDVMALDVGGATTDVYSVLTPDEHVHDEVVETLWHGRSVEGDLGMRWSAPDVVAAALAERLVAPGPLADGLAAAADRRNADVGMLPSTPQEVADDLTLARLAAVIAARRHGRPGPDGARDLTHVGLLLGSGGVLRHSEASEAAGVLDAVLGDLAGGWALPVRAQARVDRRYLLAPIGLLEMTGRSRQSRALAEVLLDER